MSETIRCVECERELTREPVPGGFLVRLKGKPPASCCQKAATDGHKVMGQFITEP